MIYPRSAFERGYILIHNRFITQLLHT